MNDATTSPLPDDEPTDEELAAAGTMRPLDDLPSPWTVTGNPTLLIADPTLAALAPADRQLVIERAGSSAPEAIDRELHNFLMERRRDFVIRGGPGEGATETERAAISQMNQLRLLTDEQARIEAELAEVLRHDTQYADDGTPTPVPVYQIEGEPRRARQNRLQELGHEMVLVAGIQGERELRAAQRADVLRSREARIQLEERAEVKRAGEALIRAERVQKGAELYAKHRRPTAG